ncbi:hypothetical protein B9T36_10910 [Acinetobacter sp. ANC 4204]|uniref:hypothetical protein n=1 Tax=Acinetobacter sp. ANC 4204 TaxID=1977884 RepID=UPI000A33250B|nr:hypothetical protein [Acinetobacter sp. ANC 4204]OTG58839.1 hypothetical protein B9T36_10910 [Acinetobacter sp. ANC 4204]
MATTPRKTQTPGAKKETTTTAQTSTDDAMDAVLGKAEESKTTEPTADDAALGETQDDQDDQDQPVEAPEGFISLEQFDAVAAQLANKEEELKGVTADLVASRKQVVKLTGGQTQQPTTQGVAQVRKKPVLTDKGWSVEQ